MEAPYQEVEVRPNHFSLSGTEIYRHFLNYYPEVVGKRVKFIYPEGREEWIAKGNYHREEGPARIFPGILSQYWLKGTI